MLMNKQKEKVEKSLKLGKDTEWKIINRSTDILLNLLKFLFWNNFP